MHVRACVCVCACLCVCVSAVLIIVSYYPVMDSLFGCIATVIVYLTRCCLLPLVKPGKDGGVCEIIFGLEHTVQY